MSLSTTQKAQIRFYLGYPDLFRYKNYRLEGVLEDGVLSADAEALVSNILVQLVALDDKLVTVQTSIAVQAAGVKKVDEIEFSEHRNVVGDLRKVGRVLVTRLSNLLGVPTFGDVYGESGYPGDSFSRGGLGSGGGGRGGSIPLG